MSAGTSFHSGQPSVLVINGGSSSIKFALHSVESPPRRFLNGKVDRIGLPGTELTFSGPVPGLKGRHSVSSSDYGAAADFLIGWLEERMGLDAVQAVGHRVVHGMNHIEPERITPELLDELRRICPYDPDHLPREIELIGAFRRRYPNLLQVACFDTGFHRTMPRRARLLPIPRRFGVMGIRRYGFHGLSYAYLMTELARLADSETAKGRVILAHLGNGASLAAVRDGQSLDTSMGFTPAGGLPMSSRPGDLDPGVAWAMIRMENLTAGGFNRIINHESGLLGVSETSSDMRDLLDRQADDERAAEAVDLFCYQTRKWIGAFAAVLGGLDTLVFSGGIGEKAPEIRERICAGLGFLGIELDAAENKASAPVISIPSSPAVVRVIPTDEEAMMAEILCRFLACPEAVPAPPEIC
jgi:acetate kinase